jgi:hypothetical protein
MLLQAALSTIHGISAARVDSALAGILARPEYTPAEPPPLYRALDAAAHWLWNALAALARWLAPHAELSPSAWSTVGLVFRVLGAVLGLALIVYLFFLTIRAIRRRRRSALRAAEQPAAAASAEDWEALAQAAAARQDWRAAAMALYQAVLMRLSREGALALDRAKTPGDYRRDLRNGDGVLAARFDAFLRGFERIAYGASAPGPDHYGRLTASAAVLGAHA